MTGRLRLATISSALKSSRATSSRARVPHSSRWSKFNRSYSSAVSGSPKDEPSSTDQLEADKDDKKVEANHELKGGTSSHSEKSLRLRENPYGNVHRRASRNKKLSPENASAVPLPRSYVTENVKLLEELSEKKDQLVAVGGPNSSDGNEVSTLQTPETTPSSPRYSINQHIWNELIATAKGGLQLPSKRPDYSFATVKAHIVLQCPKAGGSLFLNSLVERCALELNADLIRIDGQDIAEIAGDWLGDGSHPSPLSISCLGFDVHKATYAHESRRVEDEMEADEEAEEAEGEEEWDIQTPKSNQTSPNRMNMTSVQFLPMLDATSMLKDFLKSGKAQDGSSGGVYADSFFTPSNSSPTFGARDSKAVDESKIDNLIDGMVSVSGVKRVMKEVEQSNGPDLNSASTRSIELVLPEARPTIIQIQDFRELTMTHHGGSFVRALFRKVAKLRKDGHPILVIGTTSLADFVPSLTKAAVRAMQSDHDGWPLRTIVVPPERDERVDDIFKEDEARRIRQINLRHLDFMIRRKVLVPETEHQVVPGHQLNEDASEDLISGTSDSVWSFDRVHRVAQAVIGNHESEPLASTEVSQVIDTLNASDEVKYRWITEEQERSNVEHTPTTEKDGLLSNVSPVTTEETLRRVRSQCNAYEKKLLAGVINASSIKTTFDDIHVPNETIEALKSSISLSLIRPDAFSYGVLASDKLNGLLLYGPPGTGKTMLAKAVAKECGATVLEVSGAEIYDMYVGEGEKNTKAVFSLARKLAPCVIFLDEADALLGTRSRTTNRTTHRELMNQFLKEMDGAGNDKPAFVMVATNRPFDLDDAVLRRLPRRVLVDLPAEKDREAILNLHLQNEALDESVSITNLAKRTLFYSGSDLKNVAVAAAIACVKEENVEAARLQEKPFKFPERRILHQRHFDKALEEISASISDDMSSLTAIRKFDEKYGNRGGRRKKAPVLGFGSLSDAKKRMENGRVRNY